MLNKFCKKSLYEVTRKLALVAAGVEKADLVIKDARLVNVCTAEIQEHMDVAITEGRIALVGDAAHCIGPDTKIIDAQGQYIAPGFIDGHMHVESSMVTVGEYSRAVMPYGTTAIFMDPHEIANVFGLDGIKAMVDDAKLTPLKVMANASSCVPAVPGFEDTGASIDAEDIKEMMTWDDVMGLGEMMNFPGVISGNEAVHAELAETLKADQVITGHYSVPEDGAGLNAYIASGIRCCHESTRPEDVVEKMRRGMYAQMRFCSAWRDLPTVIHAVLDNQIDDRYACMVTDDMHSDTLMMYGHMDYLVRLAIELGLDPIKAIQYVTINTASCFRMEHEMGSITPSKCADIIFFDDLKDIRVTRTIIDGEVVAEQGKVLIDIPKSRFPERFYHSMHVGETITEASFIIRAPEKKAAQATVNTLITNQISGNPEKKTSNTTVNTLITNQISGTPENKATKTTVNTRVINASEGSTLTEEQWIALPVKNGIVEADPSQDVIKLAVFERHHETGTKGLGFVKGFGIQKGAIAQTVSHDAHNLLVAGTNDSDMMLATNTLIECGGGFCVVNDGKVLALLPLPIAGLLSDRPIEEVAAEVQQLELGWKQLGSGIISPYMTMALIALACIPELRLTNRGLVDCRTFKIVSLFEETEDE